MIGRSRISRIFTSFAVIEMSKSDVYFYGNWELSEEKKYYDLVRLRWLLNSPEFSEAVDLKQQ